MLRQAIAADIPSIQRVRHSVRENRLVSTTIRDDQVRDAIELTGRGWVIESAGEVLAFAVGNATNGNIWALFVHPDHEQDVTTSRRDYLSIDRVQAARACLVEAFGV